MVTAMDDDDIKKVDEWFDLHTENYGTYHADNDYAVCEWDLEAFSDFLREEFPDMVGIPCYFGKGDSAIWFFRENLEKVRFY